MKIIHITGTSNTGKTTLINQLIPALNTRGTVGVIKHLGHHSFDLAPGKDTTGYLNAGAHVSAGIDGEKTVIAIRECDLDAILRLLYDFGIVYAIIEGFKTRNFTKIILGDLNAENCILRDPSVPDILENLERFDDYRNPQPDVSEREGKPW